MRWVIFPYGVQLPTVLPNIAPKMGNCPKVKICDRQCEKIMLTVRIFQMDSGMRKKWIFDFGFFGRFSRRRKREQTASRKWDADGTRMCVALVMHLQDDLGKRLKNGRKMYPLPLNQESDR